MFFTLLLKDLKYSAKEMGDVVSSVIVSAPKYSADLKKTGNYLPFNRERGILSTLDFVI